MFLNKKKRLERFGFDDALFFAVGCLVLSGITFFLFNDTFTNRTSLDLISSWLISLFFCVLNWTVLRAIMIYLRGRFPEFEDSAKRIFILFTTIVVTILLIDTLGNIFLRYYICENYHPAQKSVIILPVILISTMIMAIYEAIYYYVRLQDSIRKEEQAKQVVIQAQLDALRNQAQPHFFFNSLNTLRDIIDQDPKKEAMNFVDKLSDVYRYILESENANVIPLKKEIQFAKAYLHIQKERFGSNLLVIWDLSTEEEEAWIVPMSIQLLLENAIKHNVVSRGKPLKISIFCEGGQLIVENPIQAKSTQMPSTKLGLANIEKRYDLISNQTITVSNDGQTFKVSLPLLNSSHQKSSYASSNH